MPWISLAWDNDVWSCFGVVPERGLSSSLLVGFHHKPQKKRGVRSSFHFFGMRVETLKGGKGREKKSSPLDAYRHWGSFYKKGRWGKRLTKRLTLLFSTSHQPKNWCHTGEIDWIREGMSLHPDRIMVNGNGWGGSYLIVRGEILWLLKDELLRKHSTRTLPLIKNESWGIEDDQIPS